jgi:hypothetical protein
MLREDKSDLGDSRQVLLLVFFRERSANTSAFSGNENISNIVSTIYIMSDVFERFEARIE